LVAEFTVIERYMRGLYECGVDFDRYFFCYVRFNSYADFEDLVFVIQTTKLVIPPENFISLVHQ